MTKRPKLLVAGYLSIDTIETPDARHDSVPGGAALYAALGARLSGADVAIAAIVGEDYPRAMLADLAAWGIDTSRIRIAAGPTRRAQLIHRPDGARSSPHHRDALWHERTRALAPQPMELDGFDMLVLAPLPLASVEAWMSAAASAGLPAIADTSEAFAGAEPQRFLAMVGRLAAFAPSREETRLLLPGLDDDKAAAGLAALGPSVLQKRGADGAWLVAKGATTGRHIPAPPTRVVDPTGAGDATLGSFAARLAAGYDLAEAARLSLHAGALAVAGIGPFALTEQLAPGPAQAVNA